MKKLGLLISSILLIVTSISCSNSIDPGFKKQIQKESSNYTQVINEISNNEISLKYPGDLELQSILPENCLFEAKSPGTPTLKCGIAVAKPPDVQTNFKLTQSDMKQMLNTFNRAGMMTPDTDKYIVTKYTGVPSIVQSFINTGSDIKDYPKIIALDYFSKYKIVQSPYFIPDETTHGIYTYEGTEFRFIKTDYTLATLINELKDENPYLEADSDSDLNPASFYDKVKNIRTQITIINKDFDNELNFVNSIDAKYFKPNNISSEKLSGLNQFKKDVENSRSQLVQIETKIQSFEKWDFSNLQKYRALLNER
jgi:hypothetical protein